MSEADRDIGKPGYVAKLIGYLSSCMLAAAIGAQVGSDWSRYWLVFGSLGLVSAIGLYYLSQSHVRAEELKRKKNVSRQTEKNLNRLVDIEESFDAIIAAVRQIKSDITETERHQSEGGSGTRMVLQKPVAITPLSESKGDESEYFVGALRNISNSGFSLAHDRFLERGYVLLVFAFENQKPIKLIADLLWCERQPDGQYFSGGKFLELVNSDDAGSLKPEFAETH